MSCCEVDMIITAMRKSVVTHNCKCMILTRLLVALLPRVYVSSDVALLCGLVRHQGQGSWLTECVNQHTQADVMFTLWSRLDTHTYRCGFWVGNSGV